MFLFLPHASLSLLSQQAACAWSTFVGLQSFLTLCRHVTIISSPPSSQSHQPLAHRHRAHVVHCPLPMLPLRSHPPWPNAVALTSFTAPRHCCRSGHITPGPMPLPSHHSRPPAVIAVAVTSPPAHHCCAHVGS
jgi:hypothetical protein